jgi:hypothetical protein
MSEWWDRNDVRVIYTFDKEGCITCLCKECGSSIKRKFLFGLIKIRKLDGCINYKCKNFYKTKKYYGEKKN